MKSWSKKKPQGRNDFAASLSFSLCDFETSRLLKGAVSRCRRGRWRPCSILLACASTLCSPPPVLPAAPCPSMSRPQTVEGRRGDGGGTERGRSGWGAMGMSEAGGRGVFGVIRTLKHLVVLVTYYFVHLQVMVYRYLEHIALRLRVLLSRALFAATTVC